VAAWLFRKSCLSCKAILMGIAAFESQAAGAICRDVWTVAGAMLAACATGAVVAAFAGSPYERHRASLAAVVVVAGAAGL